MSYGPLERYRVYSVKDGGSPRLLATCPTPASIGVCLVQLHDDAREVGERLSDEGSIGVIDGESREWIILPWSR